MDGKLLRTFLDEREHIENKISYEHEDWDIREIQRKELELLKKILQQLQLEESTRDLSWEKNNLFYSISSIHHNIRYYPTLLGLRSTLTFVDKAINEKGELTPSQKKEMEPVTMELLIDDINKLFYLVDGE